MTGVMVAGYTCYVTITPGGKNVQIKGKDKKAGHPTSIQGCLQEHRIQRTHRAS